MPIRSKFNDVQSYFEKSAFHLRSNFLLEMSEYLILILVLVTSVSTVYETQHAICKVFTKDIEATAKATITRRLKGVCSNTEMNLKFEQIFGQLQEIKQFLELHNRHALSSYQTQHFEVSENTDSYKTEQFEVSENTEKVQTVYGSTEPNNYQIEENILTLEDEISTFNDTVVESSEGDLYFYYWKVVKIRKLLKRHDMYLSSPPFLVLGHTLKIHFYPQFGNEVIGILLKPESNSFLKKHKFTLLGQTLSQNRISSRILYGLKTKDTIFKLATQMLDEQIVFDDNLLIKLKIFLQS